MMNTCNDPGETQFFDALEDVADWGSDYSGYLGSNSAREVGALCSVSSSAQFDVWIQNPESVEARRSKFFDLLGLDVNKVSGDDLEECCECQREDYNGAELRHTSFECECVSSRSHVSFYSSYESEFSGNLDVQAINYNVGDENHDSSLDGRVRDQQSEHCSSTSSSSGDYLPVKSPRTRFSMGPTKKVKKWWLNKLRSFNCVMEGELEGCSFESFDGGIIQRVKVHQSKKQTKELSALYYGQNIQAHKGAILTMKFSHDGRFLASAGEDGIVIVWQVVEADRSNELDHCYTIRGTQGRTPYRTVSSETRGKRDPNRHQQRSDHRSSITLP